MIISFAATNFRSIRERAEISMKKSGLSGHMENVHLIDKRNGVLKSAVIYGPNASGKSNLLQAMVALQFLVARSSRFKTDQKILTYEPFRLDMESVRQPVILEISFFSGSIRYDFSVSYLQNRILSEELSFYPRKVKSLLYNRSELKEFKYGEYYRGGKRNIEKLVQDNQLFISKAAENNPESLKDPYLFLSEKLIIFPFLGLNDENELAQLYIRKIAENKDSAFTRIFNKLICSLDTGIKEIKAEETDWSRITFAQPVEENVVNEIKERYKYDVRTVHPVFSGGTEAGVAEFKLKDESTGTQSLLVKAGIILEVLESGGVLAIDELEKSLHPAITRYLIRLFHSRITNPNNAQLIFATHDISLLSGDTFRRDQLWFTEKDDFGGTSLFNCAKIGGIRLHVPLDKWYSSGKLGATPLISDTEFLIEMQNNEPPL